MFTEGEKTEDGYLVHWRRAFRDRVLVSIDSYHSGPLQLVRRAVETKRDDLRDQKRGRGRAHDEIWCMFDVDEHANLKEAIEMAEANDIRLAVSNPCIELWFVLHFEDQTAHINRSVVQDRSEGFLGCRKNLSTDAVEKLVSRFDEAKSRAQGLDRKHEGDGSPPRSNPSSGIWSLVESIQFGQA